MDCTSSWEEVFFNKKYLKVMYYLAKYNPSIEAGRIARNFGMDPKDVEEMLVKLASLKIVDYEKENGYSLTDRGIMSLYNFHTNFNSK